MIQLKKYGDSKTWLRSKSPLSGSGGNVNVGKDVSKPSSNCKMFLSSVKLLKGSLANDLKSKREYSVERREKLLTFSRIGLL